MAHLTTKEKNGFERYREQIISVFKEYVDKEDVQLYLYGSRATGREHDASDIDIAVKSSDIKPVQLSRIREALHESHVPYKIDLINLTTMGESFGKSIEKEGILIWEH